MKTSKPTAAEAAPTPTDRLAETRELVDRLESRAASLRDRLDAASAGRPDDQGEAATRRQALLEGREPSYRPRTDVAALRVELADTEAALAVAKRRAAGLEAEISAGGWAELQPAFAKLLKRTLAAARELVDCQLAEAAFIASMPAGIRRPEPSRPGFDAADLQDFRYRLVHMQIREPGDPHAEVVVGLKPADWTPPPPKPAPVERPVKRLLVGASSE